MPIPGLPTAPATAIYAANNSCETGPEVSGFVIGVTVTILFVMAVFGVVRAAFESMTDPEGANPMTYLLYTLAGAVFAAATITTLPAVIAFAFFGLATAVAIHH